MFWYSLKSIILLVQIEWGLNNMCSMFKNIVTNEVNLI